MLDLEAELEELGVDRDRSTRSFVDAGPKFASSEEGLEAAGRRHMGRLLGRRRIRGPCRESRASSARLAGRECLSLTWEETEENTGACRLCAAHRSTPEGGQEEDESVTCDFPPAEEARPREVVARRPLLDARCPLRHRHPRSATRSTPISLTPILFPSALGRAPPTHPRRSLHRRPSTLPNQGTCLPSPHPPTPPTARSATRRQPISTLPLHPPTSRQVCSSVRHQRTTRSHIRSSRQVRAQ